MTYTKEQLIARIHQVTAINKYRISRDHGADGLAMDNELLAIALASLEDEAVQEWTNEQCLEFLSIAFRHAEINGDLQFDDIRLGVKIVNGSRAAMLQGAEHVTKAYKLPDDFDFDRFNDVVWLEAVASNSHMHSPITSTIAMVALELNERLEAGYSPAIPDGWVACSERMPDIGTEIFYFCQDDGLRGCGIVSSSNFSGRGHAQLYVHGEGYDMRFGVDITHWMPLPAAPQQEVTQALAKGMERYGDAMQELSKKEVK